MPKRCGPRSLPIGGPRTVPIGGPRTVPIGSATETCLFIPFSDVVFCSRHRKRLVFISVLILVSKLLVLVLVGLAISILALLRV